MKTLCSVAFAFVVTAGCGNPSITEKPGVGGHGGQAGSSSSGTGGSGGKAGSGGSGITGGGGNFANFSDGGVVAPGTGGGPGGDGTKTCGQEKFALERVPAELLLVLDRSGSMLDPAMQGGATSKWADMTAALDTSIMMTDAAVQWGLKTFPSGDVRCNVLPGVEVPIAPMNYVKVWPAIMAANPGAPNAAMSGGTPTTQAMTAAVAYLKATPSMNSRHIVLATDGEPNCGSGGGGGRMGASDGPAAIAAVAAAKTAGYNTFVIGVATGADAEVTLNGMADAGGQARMGAQKYYPVASKTDLVAAIALITGLVTDCNFKLSKAPPSPTDVAVKINGTKVDQDKGHTNGWDYGAGNMSVQLYGAICDQVKNGGTMQDVQITFGCPGVVIM